MKDSVTGKEIIGTINLNPFSPRTPIFINSEGFIVYRAENGLCTSVPEGFEIKRVTKKAEAKKAAIEKKLGKMSWTVETDNDRSIYLEGWCRIMHHHFVIRADGTATINGNNLNLRFFK